MLKNHRELVRFLRSRGVEVFASEIGGKHLRLRLGSAVGPVMITALTPSDYRWKWNCLKQAKHLLQTPQSIQGGQS